MKWKVMRYFSVLFSLLTFLIGGSIYLLYRSKTLSIFRWCKFFNIDDWIDSLREKYAHHIIISDWIKYSLPDGLWILSYLLLINALWGKSKSHLQYFWLLILPLTAVCTEIMQSLNLLYGTFDIVDIYCYLLPLLIFITIKKIQI